MSGKGTHQRAGGPPPLPPRQASGANYHLPEDYRDDEPPPPSYESITSESYEDTFLTLASNDPRSRSTQSLAPSSSEEQGDRRKLLLIFIHGFMGDETSFQSFPAHVHNLVAALLAETHTVHTKIYPRYRSKKKIEFARDDFSRWLRPHEGSTTDVILLGHSMGGLLCAEVALIPSLADGALRHRLVGTVNFDVPFLGMHPRVVKAGLASIFSPSPGPEKSPRDGEHISSNASSSNIADYFGDSPSPSNSTPQRKNSSSPFSPSQTDPNYNPAFKNDVILPVRKGWEGAWYFINKHSSDLRTATKQLVKSHLEFGGAMADYRGLKLRYTRIRSLEEQNSNTRRLAMGSPVAPPRVRFVNYYTCSTGRTSRSKGSAPEAVFVPTAATTTETPSISLEKVDKDSERYSEEFSPRNDDLLDTDDDIKEFEAAAATQGLTTMDHLEPAPMSETGGETSDNESWVDATENMDLEPSNLDVTNVLIESGSPKFEHQPHADTPPSVEPLEDAADNAVSLPPIPDPPTKPEKPPFYRDKDSRKLAEKEYERLLKVYFRAIKDREKAIRDREKLEKKRERKAIKEEKKAEKEVLKTDKGKEKERKKAIERNQTDQEKTVAAEQKEAQKEWKAALDHSWNDEDSTIEPRLEHSSSVPSAVLSSQESRSPGEVERPLKDRTFCTLPPKDGSGTRDPTWVRVVMNDVDLVGAHCGLFFPDDEDGRYEKLIGDVGERICQWVGEAESERVAREFEAQD